MRSTIFIFKLGLGLVLSILGILSLPTEPSAQMTRGGVSGTVRDSAGASFPNALVRVANPQANISREATTNDEGLFRIGDLESGNYTANVEKSGFGKAENRNLTIQQSNEKTFDVELTAGSVSDTVDVITETHAIAVNKTNATIRGTGTARQVVDLPLGATRDQNSN